MVKVATKTCRTCHECKPVNLFRKKINKCKACLAAYKREYQQKNKEKVAAYHREYRQQNKEKRREYYKTNKEKVAAYQREYFQQNKEKVAAYKREYRQRNKEEIAAKKREHYQENKEKIDAYQREYFQQNKEKITAYNREYKQQNKEKLAANQREYYQENKEKIDAYQREYQQKNKEKVAAYKREYLRKRYHSDPEFNVLCRLRKRMWNAVKAVGLDNKCASSRELLGISPQGLKEWLEAQFTDGMSWENRSEWHIDHIIPCDAFDLTVDQNQRICFWYKNLQPLWIKDNLQKSNTYTEADKQALIYAYNNQ